MSLNTKRTKNALKYSSVLLETFKRGCRIPGMTIDMWVARGFADRYKGCILRPIEIHIDNPTGIVNFPVELEDPEWYPRLCLELASVLKAEGCVHLYRNKKRLSEAFLSELYTIGRNEVTYEVDASAPQHKLSNPRPSMLFMKSVREGTAYEGGGNVATMRFRKAFSRSLAKRILRLVSSGNASKDLACHKKMRKEVADTFRDESVYREALNMDPRDQENESQTPTPDTEQPPLYMQFLSSRGVEDVAHETMAASNMIVRKLPKYVEFRRGAMKLKLRKIHRAQDRNTAPATQELREVADMTALLDHMGVASNIGCDMCGKKKNEPFRPPEMASQLVGACSACRRHEKYVVPYVVRTASAVHDKNDNDDASSSSDESSSSGSEGEEQNLAFKPTDIGKRHEGKDKSDFFGGKGKKGGKGRFMGAMCQDAESLVSQTQPVGKKHGFVGGGTLTDRHITTDMHPGPSSGKLQNFRSEGPAMRTGEEIDVASTAMEEAALEDTVREYSSKAKSDGKDARSSSESGSSSSSSDSESEAPGASDDEREAMRLYGLDGTANVGGLLDLFDKVKNKLGIGKEKPKKVSKSDLTIEAVFAEHKRKTGVDMAEVLSKFSAVDFSDTKLLLGDSADKLDEKTMAYGVANTWLHIKDKKKKRGCREFVNTNPNIFQFLEKYSTLDEGQLSQFCSLRKSKDCSTSKPRIKIHVFMRGEWEFQKNKDGVSQLTGELSDFVRFDDAPNLIHDWELSYDLQHNKKKPVLDRFEVEMSKTTEVGLVVLHDLTDLYIYRPENLNNPDVFATDASSKELDKNIRGRPKLFEWAKRTSAKALSMEIRSDLGKHNLEYLLGPRRQPDRPTVYEFLLLAVTLQSLPEMLVVDPEQASEKEMGSYAPEDLILQGYRYGSVCSKDACRLDTMKRFGKITLVATAKAPKRQTLFATGTNIGACQPLRSGDLSELLEQDYPDYVKLFRKTKFIEWAIHFKSEIKSAKFNKCIKDLFDKKDVTLYDFLLNYSRIETNTTFRYDDLYLFLHDEEHVQDNDPRRYLSFDIKDFDFDQLGEAVRVDSYGYGKVIVQIPARSEVNLYKNDGTINNKKHIAKTPESKALAKYIFGLDELERMLMAWNLPKETKSLRYLKRALVSVNDKEVQRIVQTITPGRPTLYELLLHLANLSTAAGKSDPLVHLVIPADGKVLKEKKIPKEGENPNKAAKDPLDTVEGGGKKRDNKFNTHPERFVSPIPPVHGYTLVGQYGLVAVWREGVSPEVQKKLSKGKEQHDPTHAQKPKDKRVERLKVNRLSHMGASVDDRSGSDSDSDSDDAHSSKASTNRFTISDTTSEETRTSGDSMSDSINLAKSAELEPGLESSDSSSSSSDSDSDGSSSSGSESDKPADVGVSIKDVRDQAGRAFESVTSKAIQAKEAAELKAAGIFQAAGRITALQFSKLLEQPDFFDVRNFLVKDRRSGEVLKYVQEQTKGATKGYAIADKVIDESKKSVTFWKFLEALGNAKFKKQNRLVAGVFLWRSKNGTSFENQKEKVLSFYIGKALGFHDLARVVPWVYEKRVKPLKMGYVRIYVQPMDKANSGSPKKPSHTTTDTAHSTQTQTQAHTGHEPKRTQSSPNLAPTAGYKFVESVLKERENIREIFKGVEASLVLNKVLQSRGLEKVREVFTNNEDLAKRRLHGSESIVALLKLLASTGTQSTLVGYEDKRTKKPVELQLVWFVPLAENVKNYKSPSEFFTMQSNLDLKVVKTPWQSPERTHVEHLSKDLAVLVELQNGSKDVPFLKNLNTRRTMASIGAQLQDPAFSQDEAKAENLYRFLETQNCRKVFGTVLSSTRVEDVFRNSNRGNASMLQALADTTSDKILVAPSNAHVEEFLEKSEARSKGSTAAELEERVKFIRDRLLVKTAKNARQFNSVKELLGAELSQYKISVYGASNITVILSNKSLDDLVKKNEGKARKRKEQEPEDSEEMETGSEPDGRNKKRKNQKGKGTKRPVEQQAQALDSDMILDEPDEQTRDASPTKVSRVKESLDMSVGAPDWPKLKPTKKVGADRSETDAKEEEEKKDKEPKTQETVDAKQGTIIEGFPEPKSPQATKIKDSVEFYARAAPLRQAVDNVVAQIKGGLTIPLSILVPTNSAWKDEAEVRSERPLHSVFNVKPGFDVNSFMYIADAEEGSVKIGKNDWKAVKDSKNKMLNKLLLIFRLVALEKVRVPISEDHSATVYIIPVVPDLGNNMKNLRRAIEDAVKEHESGNPAMYEQTKNALEFVKDMESALAGDEKKEESSTPSTSTSTSSSSDDGSKKSAEKQEASSPPKTERKTEVMAVLSSTKWYPTEDPRRKCSKFMKLYEIYSDQLPGPVPRHRRVIWAISNKAFKNRALGKSITDLYMNKGDEWLKQLILNYVSDIEVSLPDPSQVKDSDTFFQANSNSGKRAYLFNDKIIRSRTGATFPIKRVFKLENNDKVIVVVSDAFHGDIGKNGADV